jgi:hypothetical protein
VIIDRISHEVPFYRTYLKHAVLRGCTVINNPFMWTADDKFFGASLATKLGVASPKTVVLPNKEYVPGITTTRACATSVFPLDWQGIVDYVGLPCILKDAHGGGWKDVYVCRSLEELIHHYDQSGLLTMIVQEFIEWEQFVRCMCLGQEEVLPMKYDPRERKYRAWSTTPLPSWERASWTTRSRCARAGLRHELGRVRRARRRALRHRLHEPGARHGHQLAHAALLRLGGEGTWPTWRSAGEEGPISGGGGADGDAGRTGEDTAADEASSSTEETA